MTKTFTEQHFDWTALFMIGESYEQIAAGKVNWTSVQAAIKKILAIVELEPRPQLTRGIKKGATFTVRHRASR